MFNEFGKLLQTFESTMSAATILGTTKENIQSCCTRNRFYVKINNNRIIFRYGGDIITEDDLKNLKRINYDKEISMFDISGTLLRTFKSAKEISNIFGIAPNRITANCRRVTSFVLLDSIRYIFRYKGDIVTLSELQKVYKIKSDPKVKVIAVDNVTKEILREFDTLTEAGKYFNTHSHNISEVLSGKRKTAGKINDHPII